MTTQQDIYEEAARQTVTRAIEQIEKVYYRFLIHFNIEHSRLAKVGFLGVLYEIVLDDPHPDPLTQGGIVQYITQELDNTADGLKGAIQQHMLAVGKE